MPISIIYARCRFDYATFYIGRRDVIDVFFRCLREFAAAAADTFAAPMRFRQRFSLSPLYFSRGAMSPAMPPMIFRHSRLFFADAAFFAFDIS